MRRTVLIIPFLALGCGDTSPPPPAAQPELPSATPTTKPAPTPPTPAKPTPVVMPADLGGRAVTKALMPGVEQPELPPIAAAPKPRESELDRGEIPVKAAPIALPPAPLPEAKPARITPPKERVPSDIGGRPTIKIQTVIRPLAKAPTVVVPGAADVAPLARMLPDKPPTDDPTAELSSRLVVATKFPVPAEPPPFVRYGIPDPFENAGHLKAKLGREAEFGTAPVAVNPERK